MTLNAIAHNASGDKVSVKSCDRVAKPPLLLLLRSALSELAIAESALKVMMLVRGGCALLVICFQLNESQ